MGIDSAQEKVILATGGYDHTIHFWQAHTGICQRTVRHPDFQINALKITPNRQLLASAGFQIIRMYDIFSSNPNPVIEYKKLTSKNVTAVGFQEDGRWMYTGSEDNTTRIWDLRSETLQCQRLFSTNHPVNCVCLHPNQRELYIGDQGGNIYLWDLVQSDRNEILQKQQFFKASELDASILSIDIDAEGTFMAALDNKGNCYLFTLNLSGTDNSPAQPKRMLKLKAHNEYGLKCAFSPDSTLLATTSADCSARLWCTSDLHFILEHPQSASASLPDQSDGCTDWNTTAAPSPLMELKAVNQRWVWDVAFSNDSQYIFTASSDHLARLWSVSTGEMKREFNGHQLAVTSIAFSDNS